MGKFVRGDVVIIPFPFSDLSGNADKNLILSVAASVSETKTRDVLNSIITIISS